MDTNYLPRPTTAQLEKLFKAADEARARVSTYSEEKRAELESRGRSQLGRIN